MQIGISIKTSSAQQKLLDHVQINFLGPTFAFQFISIVTEALRDQHLNERTRRNNEMSFYCNDDDDDAIGLENGKWPYGNQASWKLRLPSATNWLQSLTNSGLTDMEFEFQFSSPNKTLNNFPLNVPSNSVRAVVESRPSSGRVQQKVKVYVLSLFSAAVVLNDSEKSTKTHQDGH